jgi:hypothetical protein
MIQIEELELLVNSLAEDEYSRFRFWFIEQDWKKWDKQIAEDSKAGKLDFLLQEAKNAKLNNKLTNL